MSFTRTVEYVTETCRYEGCSVQFAFTRAFYDLARKDHRWWYCPNGHRQAYTGKTEEQKRLDQAKVENERLRARWLAERDQAEAAKREAAEAKAREVRIRWRVGNGVCPCCSRTFPALAAHVATKHPEFVHDALSERMRQLLATIRQSTEDADAAVLDVYDMGADMRTVRALVRRGLVEQIDHHRIALTEAGWPLAEQAATR